MTSGGYLYKEAVSLSFQCSGLPWNTETGNLEAHFSRQESYQNIKNMFYIGNLPPTTGKTLTLVSLVLAPLLLLTLRWDFCTISSAMVSESTHGDDVSSGWDFLLSPTLIISPSIAMLVTQAVNSTEASRLFLLPFKTGRKQNKIKEQTKPKKFRIFSIQVYKY